MANSYYEEAEKENWDPILKRHVRSASMFRTMRTTTAKDSHGNSNSHSHRTPLRDITPYENSTSMPSNEENFNPDTRRTSVIVRSRNNGHAHGHGRPSQSQSQRRIGISINNENENKNGASGVIVDPAELDRRRRRATNKTPFQEIKIIKEERRDENQNPSSAANGGNSQSTFSPTNIMQFDNFLVGSSSNYTRVTPPPLKESSSSLSTTHRRKQSSPFGIKNRSTTGTRTIPANRTYGIPSLSVQTFR
jgi:hypothetical protein